MRAGLGVTARGTRALEPGLAPVASTRSLPPLPEMAITLARAAVGPSSPPVDRLAAILQEMYAQGANPAAAAV